MDAFLYALPIITQPVLQVLLDNVASCGRSLLRKELDGRDDFEKLRRSALDVARCVLDRAEELQYASDPLAMSWLPRLKEVIYVAEYVLLDNHNCGTRVRNPGRVTSTLSDLETAVDKVLQLGIPDVNVDRERRETSHSVTVPEVHGRDDDKTNIIKLLLPDSSEATTQREDHVPCVIIEGMTAIGKTTLAQFVFNDEVVTRKFTAKAWVFVSHHFDAKKILAAVIESSTRSPCFFSDLSALHSEIERLLSSERHLIVLDDVCTTKADDWEKLRPLFQGSETKSTILITTQNKRVADTLNVSQHLRYNLNGLSEDQCCYLLKQHAFGPGEERPTVLARVGQEIARKCGGVALAAKSLGSLLRHNREERDWLQIRDDDLWNLDERESGILRALRLSYSRLPAHLRRCFAFCSIFPRGYEINKEKLIHLWMAAGLIYYDHNTQRSFQPEDTGSKYFNDLLYMSFFEEEKRCDDGAATGYKMHDAIYNLARFVFKSEYAILGHDVPAPTDFRKIRHSSVVRAFRSPTIPDEVYNATGLLTFFLLSGGNFLRVPENLFLKFGYLHALNLSGSGLEVLEGSSLSRLVHLRLLDLSYTHIRVLPTEIKHLLYLHTLNLFHCYNLQSLSLEDMKQVKHLNNAGCKALFKMTSVQSTAFRWSLSLERLPLFVIFWPRDVGILAHLNLRGNLKILQLRKVPNDPFFPPDHQCLMHMSMLESLGLFWGDDDHRQNINPDEESVVTESEQRKQTHSSGSSSVQAGSPNDPILAARVLSHLHPPPFLKRLVISRYPGEEFPWDVPRCLNAIHLIGCVNIQHLPLLIEKECGKKEIFPDVKELALIDFPTLETWSSDLNVANAFPSLRKLIIANCPELNVIPADLNSIRHLELRHCKTTLVHSFRGLTSLETLVIDGVKDLPEFPRPFPANNPHLTSLEIKHCSQLLNLPEEMENLTGLKSLTIRGCDVLSCFPIRLYKLTALESLEISDCPGLVSLPIVRDGGFSNLRNLSIESCNNLSSWPRDFRLLTCLERLSIQFCSNLSWPLGIEHLSSLRSLTIKGCEKFTSLPEGLQNLNTMHSLEIRYCPGIQALPDWIGRLTSLRSLVISGSEIAFLPQGIASLTELQHLTIHDCPGLVESFRQGSEDWQKITHVPHRYIEGEQ